MHGVLNLLKPPGMTSHDCVAWARRVLGTRRIGHTGTLDPAACGVLPLCVGQATRVVEELQAGSKEYRAEMTLGFETDSCDATGQTVREADASQLDLETLRGALNGFRGEITQTPPLHSAVKVGGRRLYEVARAGETIEIPARQVRVSQLFVTRFTPGARPRAMLHIECGGGTYIRSLVRDIGRALSLAATMTFLVRTRSGGFSLREAATLEAVEADAMPHLTPLLAVLESCARITIKDDDLTRALAQGRRVQAEVPASDSSGRVLFRSADGTLLVLAHRADDGAFQPHKVFDLRAS